MLLVYNINFSNHSGLNQSQCSNLINLLLFWLNIALALRFFSLHSPQNSHLLSLPHFRHCIYSWLYGKFSQAIPSPSQSKFLCHILYNISAFHLESIFSQLLLKLAIIKTFKHILIHKVSHTIKFTIYLIFFN